MSGFGAIFPPKRRWSPCLFSDLGEEARSWFRFSRGDDGSHVPGDSRDALLIRVSDGVGRRD